MHHVLSLPRPLKEWQRAIVVLKNPNAKTTKKTSLDPLEARNSSRNGSEWMFYLTTSPSLNASRWCVCCWTRVLISMQKRSSWVWKPSPYVEAAEFVLLFLRASTRYQRRYRENAFRERTNKNRSSEHRKDDVRIELHKLPALLKPT